MAWTGEPAYSDPGPDLCAAAEGWRSLIEAEHFGSSSARCPAPAAACTLPRRWRLPTPSSWTAGAPLAGGRAPGAPPRERGGRARLPTERWPRETTQSLAHVYTRLEGVNLVGVLPGETREAIVLLAHHDTVRDSPGADDNGAAVAALLEVSRLLAGRRFHRSVVLAAPDFEELGLIGSRHLVPWLKQRYRLRGAIVFDAIGYMDHAPHSQSVPPGLEWLYPRQAARMRARNYAGDTVVAVYRDASRRSGSSVGPLPGCRDRPQARPGPARPSRPATRRTCRQGRAECPELLTQRPRELLARRRPGDPGERYRQLPQPELPPTERYTGDAGLQTRSRASWRRRPSSWSGWQESRQAHASPPPRGSIP